MLESIPPELRAQPQWVGFRLALKGKKLAKKPFIPPDAKRLARSNDQATWRDFQAAVESMRRGRCDAVGYALNGDIFAIDLDDSLDHSSAPSQFANGILSSIRTYTEISASGRGLHLFGLGAVHKSIRRQCVELYGEKRFIVVTGERFMDAPPGLGQFCSDELLDALGLGGEDIASNSLTSSNVSNLSNNQTPSIDSIIAQTLPIREGERNRRLLDLARGLKFDLHLDHEPLVSLKPIVQRWHAQALPAISTKPFDDTWADFANAWPKAHTPLANGSLVVAVATAESSPPPAEAAQYDSAPVRKLIAICRALQQMTGERPFYLSSYIAAAHTGITQQGAWKALNMLAADGVLRVASRKNRHQANRYFYSALAAEVKP
jgi:hypothetical protein